MKDYAKESAPGIKKYECFTEEGYGFFYYQNDEAVAILKENVDFSSF